MKYEKSQNICFVSLQSEAGAFIIQKYNIPENIDSVVLVEPDSENGKYYIQSDVILALTPYLKRYWGFIAVIRFIPRFIRDGVYDFIARIRYRVWGKLQSCPLPPPMYKNRYLQTSAEIKAVLNKFM